MQKNSVYFIVANIVGIALLVATSVHFGSPLFGWLITAGIILVFANGMEKYRRGYMHLAAEEDLLAEYKKQERPEPIGKGVIAQRIELVKDMARRSVSVDSKVFSDILSARESSTLSRSPGGLVVLLGLAGTFYGLMVAVSSAGNSLDVNNSQTTLSAIHGIFQSMKGIFGTSFCGLIGALFLNSTHQIVTGRKLAYMADVEEYTQFQLLPAHAPKADNSEEMRRSALVEQLSRVVTTMQTTMQAELGKAIESLSSNLETVTKSSLERVEQAEKAVLSRMEGMQQQASQGLNQVITDSLKRIESSTGVLVEGVGRATAESVARQSIQSQEQWNAALETVRKAMLQNAEQGKEAIDSILTVGGRVTEQGKAALDSMQAIAHKVTDQADSRAVSLAQNVGTQVEQLARDVQASFGMLADSSRELVDSQRVLLVEISKRQDSEKELAQGLQAGIGDTSTLMRINQSEFQASLELFRQGVEALLEKFTGGSAEQENQRTFIDQLHATLEAFSEKASEVLVENAMRTQEILLDVLEQSRQASIQSAPRSEAT
jgi:hypothetical protein